MFRMYPFHMIVQFILNWFLVQSLKPNTLADTMFCFGDLVKIIPEVSILSVTSSWRISVLELQLKPQFFRACLILSTLIGS